jgi:hypothetical protein
MNIKKETCNYYFEKSLVICFLEVISKHLKRFFILILLTQLDFFSIFYRIIYKCHQKCINIIFPVIYITKLVIENNNNT